MKWASANIVLLAVAIAMWIALRQQQNRLDAELVKLRADAERLPALAEENQQLTERTATGDFDPEPLTPQDLRELVRLRGEAAMLRRQTQSLSILRQDNQFLLACFEAWQTGEPMKLNVGRSSSQVTPPAGFWSARAGDENENSDRLPATRVTRSVVSDEIVMIGMSSDVVPKDEECLITLRRSEEGWRVSPTQ